MSMDIADHLLVRLGLNVGYIRRREGELTTSTHITKSQIDRFVLACGLSVSSSGYRRAKSQQTG